MHHTFVTGSWGMETVFSGQSQKRQLEQKKTTPPSALGYLCENPSLITYGAPTFNIDPCTDPVRQPQLQQEAVSRYISTHHMDQCGCPATDFEIMLLASLLTIQIFSRSTVGESRQWVCFAPGFTRNRSACPYGIYVYNITNFHYDRVIPVLCPPQ